MMPSSTPTDLPAPQIRHQCCPMCGLAPQSDVTRQVRGVILSDLLCPAGHIWFVKFLADEGCAA